MFFFVMPHLSYSMSYEHEVKVCIIAARVQDFEAAKRSVVDFWSTSATASEEQFGCGFICHESCRRHQRWPLGGPCCSGCLGELEGDHHKSSAVALWKC